MSNPPTFFSFSKNSHMEILKNKIQAQKSIRSTSFEKQANKIVKTKYHDMAQENYLMYGIEENTKTKY